MKALFWIVGLGAVMAGGVYYYRADVGAAPPQLVFAKVSRGDVVAKVDATGTLQTVDTVEVGTQVSGTISSLGVDFNDTVKRGQVVATLDQAIFLSQIEQMQAQVIRLRAEHERSQVQLLDAQTKLKRTQRLFDEQLVPATDIETAEVAGELAKANLKASEAQLSQSEASLAQSKVNLSYTVIRSPVDGIVLSRNVDVGQTVSAGLQAPTLFVIARSLDFLELAASVAESDVGKVQAGQPVTFTVDAYPQAEFNGTVRQVRLQPTVQQNVVSYTTIIDVPNPGGRLKPGMTATLSVEVERADDVLRVPASAVRFRPSDEVLVAFNGTAEVPGVGGNQSPRGNGSPRGPRGNGELAEGGRGFPQGGAPGGAVGNRGGFGGGGFPGGGAGGGFGPRTGNARGGPRQGMNGQGPATVWLLADGKLAPVRVRAGLSDGTMVALLGGPLEEGAQIVTNAISAQTAATAPSTGSPLVPAMGRGRGPR
ncbi:MAG: efflux RND transporter periplasmic adaptor subunit [Acidobacteriota bacterium]